MSVVGAVTVVAVVLADAIFVVFFVIVLLVVVAYRHNPSYHLTLPFSAWFPILTSFPKANIQTCKGIQELEPLDDYRELYKEYLGVILTLYRGSILWILPGVWVHPYVPNEH